AGPRRRDSAGHGPFGGGWRAQVRSVRDRCPGTEGRDWAGPASQCPSAPSASAFPGAGPSLRRELDGQTELRRQTGARIRVEVLGVLEIEYVLDDDVAADTVAVLIGGEQVDEPVALRRVGHVLLRIV